MVDGLLTIVTAQKVIIINKSVTLRNFLHIFKLFNNLVSIQKLIKASQCSVVFLSFILCLSGVGMRWTIKFAKEEDDLYHLLKDFNNNNKNSILLSGLSSLLEILKSSKKKIWLQHQHLEHTSFIIPKIMFPSLFKGMNIREFYCNVCELAK